MTRERSQVWGDEGALEKGPEPDAATGPNTREPERYCIRLRSGLDALYTDEVMYYGKMTTKAGVIKEKQAFARKFPVREYKVREPISVRCQRDVCWADGLVDFRAVDPVAKTSAEGVATFEYQLILWGDTMKISLETGEVKSRTRTPLPSSTSQQ